jgi:hypothetical protein
MPKITTTALAFLTALALIAIASSSASAAAWFVGGEELPTGSKAALAATAKVDTAFVLSIPKVSLKIACKGTTFGTQSAEIIGTESGKAKSLTFEGCETIEPATGCAIEGQPQSITTVPLNIAVANFTKKPADRLTLQAQTKSTLAEVTFSEKNTCALTGSEPLKGTVTFGVPKGQEASTQQVIEGLGSMENNSLEIAGGKAYVATGAASFTLATSSPFAALGGLQPQKFTYEVSIPKEESLETTVVYKDDEPVFPGTSLIIREEPTLGGEASWTAGTQGTRVCKIDLTLNPNETCTYKAKFSSGAKAKSLPDYFGEVVLDGTTVTLVGNVTS